MAMKAGDLKKAKQLVIDLSKHATLENMTTGFPRWDGYLSMNGVELLLPHKTVDAILADELARILDEAAAIGLEFDE